MGFHRLVLHARIDSPSCFGRILGWKKEGMLPGIAIAPTTSLPEVSGGQGTWDYRFNWIRYLTFTVQALGKLGFVPEADSFRRFVERNAAGSAEEIQILFGVGGERRLKEIEIKELEGYRGARPVRIGNEAETQVKSDVYGELLELARRRYEWGNHPDDDYWEFLLELVDVAAVRWQHRMNHQNERAHSAAPRSAVLSFKITRTGILDSNAWKRPLPVNDFMKTSCFSADRIRGGIPPPR